MVTLLALAAVAFLASGMLIGSVLTLYIVGLDWDSSLAGPARLPKQPIRK